MHRLQKYLQKCAKIKILQRAIQSVQIPHVEGLVIGKLSHQTFAWRLAGVRKTSQIPIACGLGTGKVCAGTLWRCLCTPYIHLFGMYCI